jgi:7-carboxy-7-deazaguanine synthase
MTGTLAFVEAFGPTIQGEGPDAGRTASFMRFGGCNLSCSWCDSAYTWDAKRFPPREQISMLTPEEIIERIPAAPLLVITGGEPLMQQKRGEAWRDFLRLAERKFGDIAIETNGTIEPDEVTQRYVRRFIVSPKLSTVEMLRPKQDRTPQTQWRYLGGRVHFKIVVSTPEGVQEALEIASRAGIPLARLWLMPEGVTPEALAERWTWLCEAAAEIGCNVSHRLHVLAWNDVRGH